MNESVWETFEGLFKTLHRMSRRMTELEARVVELEGRLQERERAATIPPPAPPNFSPLGVTLYTPGEPPTPLLFRGSEKRIFVIGNVGVDEGTEGGDSGGVVTLDTRRRVLKVERFEKETPDSGKAEHKEA